MRAGPVDLGFFAVTANGWQKVLAVFLPLFLAGCAGLLPGGRPVVTVENGELQGVSVDGVVGFKGIPYAAAPTGPLRWRPPQPASDWEGTRDASEYGPHCAQPQSDAAGFVQQPLSEDCLTLNVWAPREGARLPVMVWIHGGGYSVGSGNRPRTNSTALVREGVVLVTVNYRLSAFGFLVHPALTATAPAGEVAGNYGLQDVLAALRWVQRNISVFGGDPGNVTVFGESAGAGLVTTLLAVPDAAGLFHRAISQSGSVGLAPDPYPDRRAGFQPAAESMGERLAEKLGISNRGEPADVAARLRALSTDELLYGLSDRDRYTPVVDGRLLPDQVGTLLAEGRVNKVPFITGSNSWEASLGRQIGGGFSPEFAARLFNSLQKDRYYPGLEGDALKDAIFADLIVNSASVYTAQRLDALEVPVYRYYLSYLAEEKRGRQPGVAHEEDIAFVMQTLPLELQAPTDRDRAVSRLMSRYWVQFARTGNPNFPGAPAWEPFSTERGNVLEIGDEIAMRENWLDARMKLQIGRGIDLLGRARR